MPVDGAIAQTHTCVCVWIANEGRKKELCVWYTLYEYTYVEKTSYDFPCQKQYSATMVLLVCLFSINGFANLVDRHLLINGPRRRTLLASWFSYAVSVT